jgi:hypothetical protein
VPFRSGIGGVTYPDATINARRLGLVPNDKNRAATNHARLQAALDNHGIGAHFPAGKWWVDGTITLASGQRHHLRGEGAGASIIAAATDWAATPDGAAMVQPANPGPDLDLAITDLGFTGPGAGQVWGTAPAKLSGISAGSKMVLTRVTVANCWAGFRCIQDHEQLYHCKFNGNYAGIYFASSPAQDGGHGFFGGDVSGNTMASLLVSAGGLIEGCKFVRVHAGFGPYGILKLEDLADPNRTPTIISKSSFDVFMFEACGNAAIDTDMPEGLITRTQFTGCTHSWSTSRVIAGRAKNVAVRVGKLDQVTFGPNTLLELPPADNTPRTIVETIGDLTDVSWQIRQATLDRALSSGVLPLKVGGTIQAGARWSSERQSGVFERASSAVTRRRFVRTTATGVAPLTAGAKPTGVAVLNAGAGDVAMVVTAGEVELRMNTAVTAGDRIGPSGADATQGATVAAGTEVAALAITTAAGGADGRVRVTTGG